MYIYTYQTKVFAINHYADFQFDSNLSSFYSLHAILGIIIGILWTYYSRKCPMIATIKYIWNIFIYAEYLIKFLVQISPQAHGSRKKQIKRQIKLIMIVLFRIKYVRIRFVSILIC